GGPAAENPAGASDGELRAARLVAADRRHAEKSRGRRVRRGHPLFQCRPQAAWAGEGRDGALRFRSCAIVQGLARRRDTTIAINPRTASTAPRYAHGIWLIMKLVFG